MLEFVIVTATDSRFKSQPKGRNGLGPWTRPHGSRFRGLNSIKHAVEIAYGLDESGCITSRILTYFENPHFSWLSIARTVTHATWDYQNPPLLNDYAHTTRYIDHG